MAFCLSFSWNFIDYFKLTLKSDLLFCFTVPFSLAEKKMRFRAKRKCDSWINRTTESQSDCKDNQWFQNGFNKKQNFPTVTKSSLMNLYLKQEHQNSSISLTMHRLLTSSSWKTSCYLSKIVLKSNCKHLPADSVVRAQNKCEIRKCFTYWGGDRKKCNGHRKKFKKGSITLKNAWLPLSTSTFI